MARRKGRVLAFQALYAWESGSEDLKSLLDFLWVSEARKKNLGEEGLAFARLIAAGTIENINEIDSEISRHLVNWDFSRLNKIDLAILRVSTYTLMYQKEVHPSIVLSEAVGISKEFGSDDAFRFVNGILGAISKKIDAKGERDLLQAGENSSSGQAGVASTDNAPNGAGV